MAIERIVGLSLPRLRLDDGELAGDMASITLWALERNEGLLGRTPPRLIE